MAAGKGRNRQRRRRRRGRFGFLYTLLSFLVIFTALLVGCVVFFRVNEVTVVGNDRYAPQEIVSASGVKTGDNLLLVNKPQTVRSIVNKLPYVETVAPVRRLPDTLELRITETKAAAAFQTEEGWWLIDARGKLVELGQESIAAGLPKVLGLTPQNPSLGAALTAALEDQGRLEGLKALLTALKAGGMADGVGEFIDLTSSSAIRFAYGEDLTVVVPISGDFDRRILSLRGVLEQFGAKGETVTGTLDLTYGDTYAHLLPDQWLPESYRPAPPEPSPSTDPEPTGEPADPPATSAPPEG